MILLINAHLIDELGIPFHTEVGLEAGLYIDYKSFFVEGLISSTKIESPANL